MINNLMRHRKVFTPILLQVEDVQYGIFTSNFDFTSEKSSMKFGRGLGHITNFMKIGLNGPDDCMNV